VPFAYLQEIAVGDDRSTPNYDEVTRKVNVDEDPPEGLLLHSAGFTDDGIFRIFDVWETREQQERFFAERLMPAMQEMNIGDAAPPQKQESYELHHVVAPR